MCKFKLLMVKFIIRQQITREIRTTFALSCFLAKQQSPKLSLIPKILNLRSC